MHFKGTNDLVIESNSAALNGGWSCCDSGTSKMRKISLGAGFRWHQPVEEKTLGQIR
jgi:hypothetical protein